MAKIAYQEPYETFCGRDSSRSGPDGQVCYHVQGRPVARRFVRPSNPRTALQTKVRRIFGLSGFAWNSLSEQDKLSWESPQAAIIRTDSTGHQYTVVGRPLYCESFMYNTLTGRPTPSTGPNGTVWPFIQDITAIHPNSSSTSIVITFTPGSDYGFGLFYLTAPLSLGVRKIPNRAWRVAAIGGFSLIDFSTFPSSVTIPMNKLNLPVAVDSRIGVRIKGLSNEYLLGGPNTDAILTVGPPA